MLSDLSKWLPANNMALNLEKTGKIKCMRENSPQLALSIGYNRKYEEDMVYTKFLCLQIDFHLNWTNRIDKLVPN